MKSKFFAVCTILLLAASLAFAAQAKDDRGPLEKIVFIHYKNGHVKQAGGGAKAPVCYGFLANGAKWKATPSYVINPANNYNLSQSFVASAVFAGAEEWDAASSKELFGNNYSIDYSADAGTGAYNGRNEISWGYYADANVIAVTTVWGYFGGAPKTRQLVEFDLLFDNDFAWGDGAADASKMDLQNIATHELGHAVGLGDLYNSCTEETMYGYSQEGETKKRTLGTGDVAGIRKLYGA